MRWLRSAIVSRRGLDVDRRLNPAGDIPRRRSLVRFLQDGTTVAA
jgi:hypothetical protein